uniref:DUF4326 domain-containing protein n=1 Tax=viral metagenome TaxID=1070528 RepID=A0A6C0CGQ6_9ZZZZ
MSKPVVVRLRIKGGVIVQNCDVYIGRKQTQGGWNLKESEWENKHNVKTLGRDVAIAAFKRDLYRWVADDPHTWIPKLVSLEGKTLGCWRPPCEDESVPTCHGNVIAHLVDLCCQIVNTDGPPSEKAVDDYWHELVGQK